MTIAIVGAGAMGGIYGARLAESGADVVLLDVSRAVIDNVEADGVVLRDATGERSVRVRATDDASGIGPVDAAIVFTKGYHTESALALAAPLIGPDTVVASLQNGWGNGDVIARTVSAERIVVGVSYNSGLLVGPGRVAHTNVGPTVIGPFEGSEMAGASLNHGLLVAAGFEVEATPEIRFRTWRKLILNTATLPTAALTRLKVGPMRDEPAFSLVSAIARETMEIGAALGFSFDEAAEIATIRHVLDGNAEGKASMLQDFEAGRRSEIDTVNGAVVRIADEHGVPAPLNRAMATLVREYERANGIK